MSFRSRAFMLGAPQVVISRLSWLTYSSHCLEKLQFGRSSQIQNVYFGDVPGDVLRIIEMAFANSYLQKIERTARSIYQGHG